MAPTWQKTATGWRIENPSSGDTYDLQEGSRGRWFLSGIPPGGDPYWIEPDGWPAMDGTPVAYATRDLAEGALRAHWRVVPGHGTAAPTWITERFTAVERFLPALLAVVAEEAARALFREFLTEGCTPEKLEQAVNYACTPEGSRKIWRAMMAASGVPGWIVLAGGIRVGEDRFVTTMRHVCTPSGRALLRRTLQGLCGVGRSFAGSRTPTVSPRLAGQVAVVEHREACGCAREEHRESLGDVGAIGDALPVGPGTGGEPARTGEIIEVVPADARRAEGVRRDPTVNTRRMWKIAAQLYRDADFPTLAVRECLQNSVDAIRKAGHRSGAGLFQVTWDPRAASGSGAGGTLTCLDNGRGMTLEVFVEKFMDLGSTGKEDDAEAGGGFGVAKAAILNASRSFDWTIRSHDWEAESDPTSGQYQVFRRTDGGRVDGVEIVLRDVAPGEVYSHTFRKNLSVLDRARNVLALSNLPGIRLQLNETEVEPYFPGRRGSKLDYPLDWGEGNTVEVKAHKRADDQSGVYVRLNGLYQFTDYGISGMRSDIVVDVATRHRPEDHGYPLTPARDGFRRQASYAMSKLRDILSQEARAGGDDDREYDEYGGDGDEDFATGSETGSLFDDPEILAEATGVLGGIADLLREKVAGGTWQEAPVESTAPAAGPVTIREDPYAGWRDLATVMPTPTEATTTEGRVRVVSALDAVADATGSWLSSSLGTRIKAGNILTPEDVTHLSEILTRMDPDDAGSQTGGGGAEALARSGLTAAVGAVIEALGVSAEEDRWDPVEDQRRKAQERAKRAAEKLRKDTLAINPFGRGIKVKISRKNFDTKQRRAFKRSARKYLPHLLLWEGITQLVAAGGRVVLPFKVGFLLDNLTRAMATSSGDGIGARRWVLLNPTKLDDYLAAYPDQPAAVASYLYTLACHELAHLPHMGEFHSESFIKEREDLQMSTGHLVPTLETLLLRAFPRRFPVKTLRVGGVGAALVVREKAECTAALDRMRTRHEAALARRDAEIRTLRRAGATSTGNLGPALVAARAALDTVTRLGAGTALAAWAGGPRGRAALGVPRADIVARMLREDPARALAVIPGIPGRR